ncbi:Ankyrin repeat-containing protein [Tolypocladium capitatum]|uniref:Ankyrin repeat-containing protein n=1 Tax=Tolypocladium capitatum TaxID=45235 RepID=A0A2K3QKA4_9HYPO|nr:Ankyrin repeat-containing protein [Tolypocladium capitatum]
MHGCRGAGAGLTDAREDSAGAGYTAKPRPGGGCWHVGAWMLQGTTCKRCRPGEPPLDDPRAQRVLQLAAGRPAKEVSLGSRPSLLSSHHAAGTHEPPHGITRRGHHRVCCGWSAPVQGPVRSTAADRRTRAHGIRILGRRGHGLARAHRLPHLQTASQTPVARRPPHSPRLDLPLGCLFFLTAQHLAGRGQEAARPVTLASHRIPPGTAARCPTSQPASDQPVDPDPSTCTGPSLSPAASRAWRRKIPASCLEALPAPSPTIPRRSYMSHCLDHPLQARTRPATLALPRSPRLRPCLILPRLTAVRGSEPQYCLALTTCLPLRRKFGKQIQKRQLEVPEYAASFVNYKALKKVRLFSPITA